MNNLSLKELGTQYLQQANIIRERINLLKQQLDSLSENDRQNMMMRINSLYATARDVKDIGNYLFNYYGDANEKNY